MFKQARKQCIQTFNLTIGTFFFFHDVQDEVYSMLKLAHFMEIEDIIARIFSLKLVMPHSLLRLKQKLLYRMTNLSSPVEIFND